MDEFQLHASVLTIDASSRESPKTMLPHNIDAKAMLSVVFSEPPEDIFAPLLRAAKSKLGDETVSELSSDFEYVFGDLVEREPEHALDPMLSLFERVFAGLGAESPEDILLQFVGSMRIPLSGLQDFGMVHTVSLSRTFVREHKDEPGFGRSYTFFRQAYKIHPRAMQVAIGRRKQLKGDIEDCREALQDFQLLRQYFQSLDGDVNTYSTQQLTDLWWRAYERPVQRVCLLLWYFGQELRSPSNDKSPPPHLGALFSQARDFTNASGLSFPFRPNLNELRNAIHGRQTKIDLDLGVRLHDKHGTLIERLDFEELLDAVYHDLTFCICADQAAQHAFFRALDEQGCFDLAWSNVLKALEAAGISEDQLLGSAGQS